MNRLSIVFYYRKTFDFHFSIEKLFATIQNQLSAYTYFTNYTLPFYSNGIIPRLKNAFYARKHQGIINHITGDIHFITPLLSKKKTINTYHDFTFLKNSSGIKQFILWFFWVYLPVKRSAYITVISDSTKKELLQHVKFPKEKVLIIPNIISNIFQFIPKEFNSKKPHILHIGTTPNKNLQRLIKAIKDIPCQLVIIGNIGEEINTLLVKNNIDFTNKYQLTDAELKSEYIQCDLVSFCSLNEGFGMPILEAQATGRPVITSNISSMPEVAGEAACLVDPYDINSIKQGIEKIISNEDYRNTLISKGRENIKRFDPSTIARMYESLYNKLYSELNYKKK